MKNAVEYEFCMKQFRPAIAGLAVLVVIVLGWTGWHCTQRAERRASLLFAATNAPAGPPIRVQDKMLHPYWGNCNKCHVTIIDVKTPISKVMAGAPISITAKMPHDYWGNCLLCHEVIDGIKPKTTFQAKAAAFNGSGARTVGLKVETVTAAMMKKVGLANEDGVLVLEVAKGSVAEKAGLQQGDEIVRVGKTRVETTNAFETALQKSKPGSKLKVGIYRGTKQRNVYLKLPHNLTTAAATAPMTQNQIETLAEQLGVPKTQQDVAMALQRQKQAQAAAATAPMTQNQVETLAEQLGVPKTQQDVARALQRQKQAQAAAVNFNYGKVAIAAMGPGPGYQVSPQFGSNPYFLIYDPQQNSYRVVANPNANDAAGRGVQTGQYIVDMGVSNVIAGSFGQSALQTLRSLRVNAYSGVTGSAQSTLSSYLAGQLIPANMAQNVGIVRPPAYAPPVAAGQQMQTVY